MANIIPPPIPSDRSATPPHEAGLKDYLKEAFLFRWNMLFFLGGVAGAAIAPLAGVTLPLVFAGELTYLAALTSLPRFRAAIAAKVHAAQGTTPAPATAAPSLVVMLAGLARRFAEAVRTAARAVRGNAAAGRRRSRWIRT